MSETIKFEEIFLNKYEIIQCMAIKDPILKPENDVELFIATSSGISCHKKGKLVSYLPIRECLIFFSYN